MKARISQQTFEIKYGLAPSFYDHFSCIAADCQDNCCQNWVIPFDKADETRLRKLDVPPEYRALLDAAVQPLDPPVQNLCAKFALTSTGSCPLITEDGLCSLQICAGAEALPEVCRVFPRKEMLTIQGKEKHLSVGCEAVLQLLWDLPQGIDFIQTDLPPEEHQSIPVAAAQYLPWYTEIRSLCIDILQERSLSLGHRMIYMGMALRDLRSFSLTQEGMAAWEQKYLSLLHDPSLAATLQGVQGNRILFLQENLSLIHTIKEQWCLDILLELCLMEAPFQQIEAIAVTDLRHLPEFYETGLTNLQNAFGDLDYFLENIMVNLVYETSLDTVLSFQQIWNNYVYLCKLYSLLRFLMGVVCATEVDRKRLFHYLVLCGRSFVHSEIRQKDLEKAATLKNFNVEKYTTNDFGNLAILVCG